MKENAYVLVQFPHEWHQNAKRLLRVMVRNRFVVIKCILCSDLENAMEALNRDGRTPDPDKQRDCFGRSKIDAFILRLFYHEVDNDAKR